jgi:hypothetical protein
MTGMTSAPIWFSLGRTSQFFIDNIKDLLDNLVRMVVQPLYLFPALGAKWG